MNIPADASPNLILGRSYDAECSRPGNDVFPSDIPTKKTNVNKFSFKYQIVKSSKDVNDLLDVSGELSLKIKAGLIKVEGKGQYVNECKIEEGKTTLLAVMNCTTVRIWKPLSLIRLLASTFFTKSAILFVYAFLIYI